MYSKEYVAYCKSYCEMCDNVIAGFLEIRASQCPICYIGKVIHVSED
jgi:hypothetical protein